MDLIDANEAELFVLLIGQRELRRMGCVNVILKAILFSYSVVFW